VNDDAGSENVYQNPERRKKKRHSLKGITRRLSNSKKAVVTTVQSAVASTSITRRISDESPEVPETPESIYQNQNPYENDGQSRSDDVNDDAGSENVYQNPERRKKKRHSLKGITRRLSNSKKAVVTTVQSVVASTSITRRISSKKRSARRSDRQQEEGRPDRRSDRQQEEGQEHIYLYAQQTQRPRRRQVSTKPEEQIDVIYENHIPEEDQKFTFERDRIANRIPNWSEYQNISSLMSELPNASRPPALEEVTEEEEHIYQPNGLTEESSPPALEEEEHIYQPNGLEEEHIYQPNGLENVPRVPRVPREEDGYVIPYVPREEGGYLVP